MMCRNLLHSLQKKYNYSGDFYVTTKPIFTQQDYRS